MRKLLWKTFFSIVNSLVWCSPLSPPAVLIIPYLHSFFHLFRFSNTFGWFAMPQFLYFFCFRNLTAQNRNLLWKVTSSKYAVCCMYAVCMSVCCMLYFVICQSKSPYYASVVPRRMKPVVAIKQRIWYIGGDGESRWIIGPLARKVNWRWFFCCTTTCPVAIATIRTYNKMTIEKNRAVQKTHGGNRNGSSVRHLRWCRRA